MEERREADRDGQTKPEASGVTKPHRIPIIPTALQRRRVERCVTDGVAEVEIARSLAVSLRALKKHFAEELRRGRESRRADGYSRPGPVSPTSEPTARASGGER
jgi:hypothetical protein